MLIEHTLKRFAAKDGEPHGSFVLLGQTNYHFKPLVVADKSSPQVADVENATHQQVLLNQLPRVFVEFAGELPAETPVAAPAVKPAVKAPVVKVAPVTPLGTGHPDEVQVGLDAPKAPVGKVISAAIEKMGLSVEEWNAMSESARFQAVEEIISLEREAEAAEKRRLEELSGDGLKTPGDDGSTGSGKLVDMTDKKLNKLANGYGIKTTGLTRDQVIEALKPMVPAAAL